MLNVGSKEPFAHRRRPPAADDAALLAELGSLHRHVSGLPDLRIEKVFEARRAVRNGLYDSQNLIESLLDRMANDIGVLCRRDSGK
jgi:hypothetical protein